MRGRLTLEKVNTAIDEMATFATGNAKLLSAPRQKACEVSPKHLFGMGKLSVHSNPELEFWGVPLLLVIGILLFLMFDCLKCSLARKDGTECWYVSSTLISHDFYFVYTNCCSASKLHTNLRGLGWLLVFFFPLYRNISKVQTQIFNLSSVRIEHLHMLGECRSYEI